MMNESHASSGRRSVRRFLDIAGRAALRGWGFVEPNPMVGCVIATESGECVAVGHHKRFGSAHAEVEALRACRERGVDPRGLVAYVTLEPCNHQGKTPACTAALLNAGISRVVCARQDPFPPAAGGAAHMIARGVPVLFSDASRIACEVARPFIHRVESGLPWVIAKWAQTIDGRIATRTGDSWWISGETSRRRVHALRGRVDAVLTGIGTVLADDPQLTARSVPVRRIAQRIVVDPGARTPPESRLVRSEHQAPVLIVHAPDPTARARAKTLQTLGVQTLEWEQSEIDLRRLLAWLSAERGVSSVLVEAGPGLMGRLARADLIDELWQFTGAQLLGDEEAMPPVRGDVVPRIADGRRYRLLRTRSIGDDVLSIYRRERE